MPSIPQSLLWISLVVLWLFVLVPMLISKRESVRRTSDVALATRVLNSGRNAQRLRRGPAAGHNSDPHWRPMPDHLDDDLEAELEETEPSRPPKRAVVVAAAATEPAEPDYLDVDIVEEDSGALPLGATHVQEVEDVEEATLVDDDPQTDQLPLNLEEPAEDAAEDVTEEPAEDVSEEPAEQTQEPVDEDDTADDQSDLAAHEYEYVADSSGLEAEAEPETAEDEAPASAMSHSRQRRMESKTAQQVSERKYRFRKRVLSLFALILVGSAAAAFLLTPTAWWVCGTAATLTVLYLAYLRRQTRIEEQLRRRRAQRLRRSRLGVENTDDSKLDVVPARLRRPGAVVLDIDDEDPIFEHLEYTRFTREYDLPRASGQ
ncbi:gephyrin-like molybdotransferase receptor GlpR [Mycolicibacterium goodii]|uniref:Membrane protein n=1 Tax=Mycolicibacterium goodii TaxID=134601 RepID=A0A0K0X5F2_MYCGD|nr:membrane protein [Mycolicibacterium goodii]